MDKKNNAYYLGIDLCDTYAMVSFYQLNMEEPDTVSTIAGSENYRIPLILARRKNVGMWYYGDEARKMAKTSEVLCVDCLLQRAINKEKILVGDTSYDAVELLALFLKKEWAGQWINLPSDSEEITRYLRGETLNTDQLPGERHLTGKNGWVLVCVDGCSLGWSKKVGITLKNHYPKGLRRP